MTQYVQTKASPMALEMAVMKRKTDMTSERMFLGALVKAYSSPVMDAKISLNAMRTYAPVWIQTLRGEVIALPSASSQVEAE
jgi:hypothetical protein